MVTDITNENQWIEKIKDVGTMDFHSNFIQDVFEYKGYQFICHLESFKNGIIGSWEERKGLKILRISHSKNNKLTEKCPLCKNDRDFKCDPANLEESRERVAKVLDFKRRYNYPVNLMK